MRQTIFISSVQSEFEAERSMIAEYIRTDALFARYFEPFLFEELPAQDVSAQKAYLDAASTADIYIVLVGERYGYEDTEGVSPTEREYDIATENSAYRLAFVKDVEKRNSKEEKFKNKIEQDITRNPILFSTIDELRNNVYAALVHYLFVKRKLISGPFDASLHPIASLADLDKNKIRRFVGLAREKRKFPIQYSEEHIHTILSSLHLISDNDEVTNAALLLFGKDVQKWFISATIKCAHFPTELMSKPILSQQLIEGDVFEVIDGAVDFVLSKIDASVGERTQSAQADIRYELPVQAVTEAIVNAVIHRDYTSTGSVQVMLFKDRLEVWNPGRLPYGITLAKLSGEHNSIPVNPLLARPVYLAGYIEQLGTGTTDLINRCIEYGLREPEFYQNENFRTIIWRKTSNHDTNHDTNHDSNHDEVLSNNKSNENKIVYDEEINTLSNQVRRVVLALGNARLTREELLDKMELRNRGNLRERYINPAVEAGYVKLRFPDSLQRKDQAYYLTRKGIKLLNKLKKLGNN